MRDVAVSAVPLLHPLLLGGELLCNNNTREALREGPRGEEVRHSAELSTKLPAT